MYGTVSTICCDLLKVYENHEKIAVIIWCEGDVREMGRSLIRPLMTYRPYCAPLASRTVMRSGVMVLARILLRVYYAS